MYSSIASAEVSGASRGAIVHDTEKIDHLIRRNILCARVELIGPLPGNVFLELACEDSFYNVAFRNRPLSASALVDS